MAEEDNIYNILYNIAISVENFDDFIKYLKHLEVYSIKEDTISERTSQYIEAMTACIENERNNSDIVNSNLISFKLLSLILYRALSYQ